MSAGTSPRLAVGAGLCLVALSLPPTAAAQEAVSLADTLEDTLEGRVALVVTGPDGPSAARAFETFVPIEADMILGATPALPPAAATVLVSIDTSIPVVQVWRRRDGVVFERRFEGPEDGYALAVVASELLEVARTGGDPTSVGATVITRTNVVEPATSATETAPVEAVDTTDPVEPEALAEPARVVEPASIDEATAGAIAEGTIGVGAEGWLSPESGPWIVQPTLFLELLGGRSDQDWRVGGAVFASALGAYELEEGAFVGSYARHDFGARLSVGGDLGPLRTRLLGHLRAGGSVVVGNAHEGNDDDDDDESAIRPGWFVGLALDLRQPLVEGLEIFLEIGADLLPAPVRFTALGTTLVREPSVRLAARLGLAWRFR